MGRLVFGVIKIIKNTKQYILGPYEVKFKSAYHCPNVGIEAFIYPTKFSKVNHTHITYSGKIKAKRGLTNNMSGTLDFSVFGNGGWKENFIHIQLEKVCSDLQRTLPGVAEGFVAASGKEYHCPMPPGDYEINNWLFEVTFVMPVFPYGQYKVVATAWEEKQILTCFTLEVEVVPKEKPNSS